MDVSQIISFHDLSASELEVYTRLTEAALRNTPRQKLFIAESVAVIENALDAGYEPVSFLMERRHIDGKASALLARCPDVPVYTADDDLLVKLTGYHLTRGVLCAMRRKELPGIEALCAKSSRICVLEGVSDSTNIGAIFRSSAALGADAVLLSPDCCDPLCRRSVRVSMGSVFCIPWTYFPGWPAPGLKILKKNDFYTLAFALSDDSIPLDGLTKSYSNKLALLFGSEGHGLKQETVSAADCVVRIPMSSGVDSLNVAASAAVVLWHLRILDGLGSRE